MLHPLQVSQLPHCGRLIAMDPLEQRTPTAPPAPASQRRGCLGCLLTSSLGCAAFLFGSLVAALGFAPSMLGGVAARALELAVSKGIDGHVEIRGMNLAWDSPQKIQDLRLFDPEGRLVLGLKLTLPSLLTLLESQRETWKVRIRVHEADLRFVPSGLSNLDRALAHRGQRLSTRRSTWTLDEFDSRRFLSQTFPYEFSINAVQNAVRLTLEQGEEAVDGAPARALVVDLREFQLDFSHRPGERDDLQFEIRVATQGREGHLRFDGGLVRGAGQRAEVDAELTLTALPTALVDALVGWEVRLAELVGPSLDGTLSLVGDLRGEAVLEVSIQGPGDASLDLQGVLADGVLRPGDEGRCTGRVFLPERLCERVIDPHLPAGTQLLRDSPDVAWNLEGRDFALTLGLGTPAGFSLRAMLEQVRGTLELRPESRLRCVGPDRDRELLILSEVVVSITLDEDSPPRLDLVAAVNDRDGQDGTLRVSLIAREGLEGLRQGTATVDIELTGQLGSLEILGELDAGILQGARMQLSLPPGSRSRSELLGLLVPWIEEFDESDESAKGDSLVLTLLDYRLPLDGDLREVRARANLELGRVDYRLHPAFHALFHAAETEREVIEQVFSPVRMTIDRGIVTFEDLTLDIGGGECHIRGRYDLSDDSLDLRADVPVAFVLRRDAEDALAVRVPVTISGTWPEPRLLMDRELMDAITGGVGKLMDWLGVFRGTGDR